jgi:hypothetical protein
MRAVRYSFTAFNGATNLGTFAVPAHTSEIEIKNISALDGGQAITCLSLFLTSSLPTIGLQLQAASFTAVPEPSSVISRPAPSRPGRPRRRPGVESMTSCSTPLT